MAPPSRETSRTVNVAQLISMFLAFLMVAGVGGVLSAGFVMPAVATVGATTDAASRMFDELPTELGSEELSEQSVIVAGDGSLLARFYLENRIVRPMDDISENMQMAVVAVEDRRFYDHGGVDPEGIMRAAVQNVLGLSDQGGSTLTQQYVKNVLIEAGRRAEDADAIAAATAPTIARKLREAKLAIALEQQRSKDEILEGYLNIAQFGPSQYGVEAASRYFFSHSAAELTLAEAALLAGITQNPAKWNPAVNPENAQNRRDTVLQLMLNQGKITQEEYDEAVETPVEDMLEVQNTPNGCATAGISAYFCDYVKAEILQSPEFGETQADRYQLLVRGGLRIETTIDPEMQQEAVDALTEHIPMDDPSGVSTATSTIEPGTGRILAMAQNTPYGTPSDDEPRATQVNFNTDQNRGGSQGFQTGSTFKAFVLTQWLIDGHSLSDRVDGTDNQSFPRSSWNTCLPQFVDVKAWEPNNIENAGGSQMTVLDATRQSVNTAFANMSNQLNQCDIADTVQRMGFHHATVEPGEPYTGPGYDEPYGDYSMAVVPSMALGANEVAPLTMAAAFATYASGGTYCTPIAITRVVNQDGEDLPVPDAECNQVLEPRVANAMNHALQEVASDGGTGENAVLSDRPIAGKTGTANDDSAAWFVGYVPQLATAVWAGYSEGTESMFWETINGTTREFWYGGNLAAPIWQDYMSEATDGMAVEEFEEARDREIYGERKPVPSVSGMTRVDAENALRSAGFSTYVGATAYSDSVPDGRVIGTSPGAGSQIRPGSSVGLVISDGPEPEEEETEEPDDNNGNNDDGDGDGGNDNGGDGGGGGNDDDGDDDDGDRGNNGGGNGRGNN
ncbi:penicillin-binding protein [Ruania alba]|uniref:Membrane carboxypeptidase (Penicillin-binding protein) n=1 Tax=Ruania alba TaxID=648782 RepID=A0A1H5MNS9_9MICO|nr:transglycosylase domain-containing protein [Ruania alba]SEE90873.1 Membrane carboxypeptidase (penicillin-binding protein) [Ruania alba]